MIHKPYCEGCGKPASKTHWEFARDPAGRLCGSCVANGVNLAESTRERSRSAKGRSSGPVNAELQALLRAAHAAKLRGDIPPLFPGELSVYEPNAPSCLAKRTRHGHRQPTQRSTDVRPLRRRASVDRLHANGP